MLFVANILEKHRISQTSSLSKKGLEKLYEKKSTLPAITHVDYSARIQTVDKNFNKDFFDLIECFKKKTNCPVLLNTSFNIRGEPIVNTPEDAFNCFMGTELDLLVIENFVLEKKLQKTNLIKDYKNKYELD